MRRLRCRACSMQLDAARARHVRPVPTALLLVIDDAPAGGRRRDLRHAPPGERRALADPRAGGWSARSTTSSRRAGDCTAAGTGGRRSPRSRTSAGRCAAQSCLSSTTNWFSPRPPGPRRPATRAALGGGRRPHRPPRPGGLIRGPGVSLGEDRPTRPEVELRPAPRGPSGGRRGDLSARVDEALVKEQGGDSRATRTWAPRLSTTRA